MILPALLSFVNKHRIYLTYSAYPHVQGRFHDAHTLWYNLFSNRYLDGLKRNMRMTTETITIRVDPLIAKRFNTASADQQRKVELLLNLRLLEAFDTSETLEELMRRMSRTAQGNGLTPEILKDILSDVDA